jgi:hypothetical protein
MKDHVFETGGLFLPEVFSAGEKFPYGFKAARGAARAVGSGRPAALPLTLPRGRPLHPADWREKQDGAAETRGSRPGRGRFDKGTLAAAHIGLMRAGVSQPDPQTSVRAAAPCQIHRSVSAELTVRCRSRNTQEPAATVKNSLTVVANSHAGWIPNRHTREACR